MKKETLIQSEKDAIAFWKKRIQGYERAIEECKKNIENSESIIKSKTT